MIKSLFLVLICNGKKRVIDLMPYLFGVKSENDWEESKHPRDKDGRFSQSGEEPSQSKEKRGKIKRRRKAVQLSKAEYATVQHAFMTDVTKEQRGKKVLEKYIGDFLYIGILRADGTRDIVGKVKIYGID